MNELSNFTPGLLNNLTKCWKIILQQSCYWKLFDCSCCAIVFLLLLLSYTTPFKDITNFSWDIKLQACTESNILHYDLCIWPRERYSQLLFLSDQAHYQKTFIDYPHTPTLFFQNISLKNEKHFPIHVHNALLQDINNSFCLFSTFFSKWNQILCTNKFNFTTIFNKENIAILKIFTFLCLYHKLP
jgi:hypothetical protein